MSYSILNLKSDLQGVLHGTTINQITGINTLISRAARQLILDCDPMETKRISPISGTVFNEVWDYSVPVDLKGDKVIDLFPQVNRYPTDLWGQVYNQFFDRTKGLPWSVDMFTILFNSSLKSMRINAPFLLPPITLDTCDAIGNWTASGGATGLTLDNVNYVSTAGSLRFNLSAGQSSGTLSETLTSPIDLSAHLNQSTLFIYTYLPTPSAVSSVILKWGTDSSDYYQVTATTTQQLTAFQTGWNLLPFPWLGATVVGSPNPSQINYLSVTWNYNSTLQTAVRLDNINSNLGSILNIEYYSKYLFRDAITGSYQETVTDDSNLVNLDTDSYNLLMFLSAHYCMQQQQGLDALFYDGSFFQEKYNSALTRYMALYKSEIQTPQSVYYKMNKGGYGLFGNRWNS